MPELLLIMRKKGNLKVMGEALRKHGYEVSGVSAREELEVGLLSSAPDAALVDVTGYRDEIWGMCELLQQSQIPFLVISGSAAGEVGGRGRGYGAASVLEKPLAKNSLLQLLTGLTQR